MMPRTTRGLWLAVAAVAIAVAGCSSDTHPTAPISSATRTAALSVAATFNQMGDSVVAAHGDSDAATRFYGIAAVLMRAPVFDTITIKIDSVPMTFDAVAVAVNDSGGPTTCPMPPMDDDRDAAYECPGLLPHMTRTLVAWQPGDPPHIVQLVAMADTGAIGLPFGHGFGFGGADSAGRDTGAVTLKIPARLKYYDGGPGKYWGTAGTQQNSVAPNGQACPTPPDTAAADTTSKDSTSADRAGRHHEGHSWSSADNVGTVACQMADFNFKFSGTVGVPPVSWWQRNTASGTHTISLDASKVPGAYLTLTMTPMGG